LNDKKYTYFNNENELNQAKIEKKNLQEKVEKLTKEKLAIIE